MSCDKCGKDSDDVHLYTPDLDIKPVALCRPCWAEIFGLLPRPLASRTPESTEGDIQ